MTTFDFIAELFCRVDDTMKDVLKDPRANLWPSEVVTEVVTLGVLFVLKGKSERAFYRWVKRDCLFLFPNLPERTRLFRLLSTHRLFIVFGQTVFLPNRPCLACAIVSAWS